MSTRQGAAWHFGNRKENWELLCSFVSLKPHHHHVTAVVHRGAFCPFFVLYQLKRYKSDHNPTNSFYFMK